MLIPIAVSLALALSANTPQQVDRAKAMADSSAAQIVARLRAEGDAATWVTMIMREEAKPQPRAKLDAIADGLADLVIAAHAGTPSQRASDAAQDALLTLVGAGTAGPNRYDGSLDRLIRIHRVTASRSALRWLTAVPGSDRALSYLRDVAVSGGPTAWSAISALRTEAELGGYGNNPEPSRRDAQNILRELFHTDAVKEPVAAELLLAYGRGQGWRRNQYGDHGGGVMPVPGREKPCRNHGSKQPRATAWQICATWFVPPTTLY